MVNKKDNYVWATAKFGLIIGKIQIWQNLATLAWRKGGGSLGWSRTGSTMIRIQSNMTFVNNTTDIVSDLAPLAENDLLSLLYFLIYSLFCSMNKRNFNPDDEKSDE